jgi:tripartite-type tricarboxylate transporter receptor subunit TctC
MTGPRWPDLLKTMLAALLTVSMPSLAAAQWPEKPIKLLVPFPAGGAVDIVARVIAAKLADDLGKPIVIENKAGAGGIIATNETAKAAPDGYTLLLTTPNHTINPALNEAMPYNTEKDIAPVSIVAEVPEVLVSHPGAPFKTFPEFIAHARHNPGKLNYSSAGIGTLPHVTFELLLRKTGIQVAHIPYRGAAPAMNDLLAGVVQLKLDTYATSSAHVKAGKLHMLGIASKERSKLMPETPTIAEMGLPGYEGILWIGMVAPAGTPKAVIERLAAANAKAARAPDVVEKFQNIGVDPVGGTTTEFAALIARELPQWRDLVKAANIKVQ